MTRFHSEAANNNPDITKPPKVPESVWQQPQKTHLINIHKNSTTKNHNSTHMPKFKRRKDVVSQKSPKK